MGYVNEAKIASSFGGAGGFGSSGGTGDTGSTGGPVIPLKQQQQHHHAGQEVRNSLEQGASGGPTYVLRGS